MPPLRTNLRPSFNPSVTNPTPLSTAHHSGLDGYTGRINPMNFGLFIVVAGCLPTLFLSFYRFLHTPRHFLSASLLPGSPPSSPVRSGSTLSGKFVSRPKSDLQPAKSHFSSRPHFGDGRRDVL